MLRFFFQIFLLLLAGALVAVGLLTTVKSPDWAPWKLAILATEFGHWVAVGTLVVAGLAWAARGGRWWLTAVTLLASAVALGLFLKPVVQAELVAQALPAQLEKAFGPVELARAPFALTAIAGADPAPVALETMTYSGELALDFYRAVGREKAPCVIIVHGGGWDSGERTEIAHFDWWLARHGYAVAAISYRLAPTARWPAQRDDVLAAIAFVKAHAEKLGVDATRLVLFGRSAGGNIAEATAYTTSDPAIRGLVAFYAPADMHFAWAYAREDDVLKSPLLLKQFLGGTPQEAKAAYDSASAFLHVAKDNPPTLLVHGELDTLVWYRQSERLAGRLTAEGVPHAFVSFPWATHACEYNLHGPGGQLSTYALEWFLAAVTAGGNSFDQNAKTPRR